jgi:REP-associated tyrosine transposase
MGVVPMARKHRFAPGGVIYHVMNRGSRKGVILENDDQFLAFERLLEEARTKRPMRILAYCFMLNHWHLLLWPSTDTALSRFMQWLEGTHATRQRRLTNTRGQGAFYQSRFVAIGVTDVQHLWVAWRYVERNPIEAGLVLRSEDWRWSSAHPADRRGLELDAPPYKRPDDWLDFVNADFASSSCAA